MPPAATAKPIVTVQVRQLVEFALRTGDLGSERDFVGPGRALAGTRGHQRVQRSRPAGYQKEVRVSYDLETDELTLRVQGRIDGLVADADPVLVEEIKTVQGRWDGTADPLHWAQTRIYGFIYGHEHGLKEIDLRLTYLDLDSGKLTEFTERLSLVDLAEFFHRATAIYHAWALDHQRWRRQRDRSIGGLPFPFPEYRPGQRQAAVSAYRAITRGERLFLEAPTGIGKTISVLFPSVKALAEGKAERIFYLTARTTTRAVAEKALSGLRKAGLRLRSLTLTAKEKLCVREGQPCDPQQCPLARGYYDRRKAAMREALSREEITREVLEAVGAAHQVCPFELSLDISMWVDAVICDYNYVFDPHVYLRRHFDGENANSVFLIDEAHNLVDRGREMFSAGVSVQSIRDVRREIQHQLPRCAKALGKLSAAIRALSGPAAPEDASDESGPAPGELDLFQHPRTSRATAASVGSAGAECSGGQGRAADEFRIYRELPATLAPLLENALAQAEAWLVRNEPAEFRLSLLGLYFELFSLLRTMERYDERFRTLLAGGKAARITVLCLDPSFLLNQALRRGKAAVFFSATLTPIEYYRELLGGSSQDPVLQLPSPFPPDNLATLINQRIRTQFKDRDATLGAVVDCIGAFVQARPGNYLVYLPSYQYLMDVQKLFEQRYPSAITLEQRPGMNETDRDDFLAAFAVDHGQTRVGFAVMGGIFGEGIDLTGDRLIGAVIIGVGLPQLCVERDLIREYFQEKIGAGFDYAYTYPGMNRVLQAIGRVIRSETDRGAVLLVDTRFGEPRYRRLFPPWWQVRRIATPAEIAVTLREFWTPPEARALSSRISYTSSDTSSHT